MQEYTIIERYINGIETIGFIVKDNSNNKKTLKIEDILKLALSKRITNAEAILNDDTNDYELLITDIESIKNSENEHTDRYIITNRIIADNCLKGYIVKDKNGSKYKLDAIKAWKLAHNNKIDGIKACIIDNKKVLISTDKENPILKQLRDIQENN